MLKLCKKCWWWRGQTGGGGKASKTDDRDGAMVAQRQGWATICFGITEKEPGFLFVWRQSWVLIWRFSWTWGALLRDNLNLFQVFIQFKTEVKHSNPFSTLNVESGNNELNTCSINTHSNITPLSLPLKDPSTRSPYVAFGLSSLFPQTGGATSTQINDLFCLPTSLRRRMVEFSRTRLEGSIVGNPGQLNFSAFQPAPKNWQNCREHK